MHLFFVKLTLSHPHNYPRSTSFYKVGLNALQKLSRRSFNQLYLAVTKWLRNLYQYLKKKKYLFSLQMITEENGDVQKHFFFQMLKLYF